MHLSRWRAGPTVSDGGKSALPSHEGPQQHAVGAEGEQRLGTQPVAETIVKLSRQIWLYLKLPKFKKRIA